MTYKEFRLKVYEELGNIYDSREAENITWLLLEDASGLSQSKLRSLESEEISEITTFRVYKYLHGVLQHQPVQYALGHAWFYKHRYTVNSTVLIPRPETEELVYRIVKECRGRKVSVLDIGTGSGCIAISLQLELSDAAVTAIDVSKEALTTARKNAEDLKAEQICFDENNILNEADWSKLGLYDIIVSNPPYITEAEKADMQDHVLKYEPASALFVTNGDPLQFYKAIATFAQTHLLPGGQLFFECNEEYATGVETLLKQNNFTETEILKDMQGKNRMIQARLNK